jgi:hypothetical protein
MIMEAFRRLQNPINRWIRESPGLQPEQNLYKQLVWQSIKLMLARGDTHLEKRIRLREEKGDKLSFNFLEAYAASSDWGSRSFKEHVFLQMVDLSGLQWSTPQTLHVLYDINIAPLLRCNELREKAKAEGEGLPYTRKLFAAIAALVVEGVLTGNMI